MTTPVAAQDESAIVPPEWTDLVLPSRGNGLRRPVTPDPEAAAKAAEWTAAGREQCDAILDHPESDPALVKAARAHLDGAPDPVGAAVVTNLLRYSEGARASAEGRDRDNVPVVLFDAHAAAHGLPFAVCAAIEQLTCDLRWFHDPVENGSRPGIVPGGPSYRDWQDFADPDGLAAHARARLAAADEEDYLAVVARVDDHRDTETRRFAAALHLPDETDWVAEACEEQRGQAGNYAIGPLLWSLVADPEHLRRLGRPLAVVDVRADVLAALLLNLGGAALPVLAGALDQKLDFARRALLHEAAGMLPTADAARFLTDRAAAPEALDGLSGIARIAPAHLARAVAARAADLAPVAAARLREALLEAEVPLADVLDGLAAPERTALTELLTGAVPVAGLDRLPEALVAPPWTAKPARDTTEPLEGLTAPDTIALVWAAGERERALAAEPSFATWDDAYWNDPTASGIGAAERAWGRLAHFGAERADEIVAGMALNAKYAEAIVPVRSAAAGALVADWFTRLKSAQFHALDWLHRHREHAVPFLVPPALGGTKTQRAGGGAALRHLSALLGAQTVLDAAEPFGPEARERVRALLAVHPDVPLPHRPPTPGPWADPSLLPPVMLRGGDASLPPEAVRDLIAALALWTVRLPFPGVERYAEHCDQDSLRAFSLALFELWRDADAPSKDSWAVDQLGRFGDDATAAVLGPLARAWPGQSQADRALRGIEVLGRIGTDTAFAHLRAIALDSRSRAVAARARVFADGLAAARRLDTEAYADLLVPDHGVADPATLTFDYGPRRFHVRFDRLLRPHLTDDDGKPRKSLPRPGVRDDEAVAKASIARYRALVKAVETTAETQIHRLRDAMLEARTWTPATFATLLAHPLVRPFAARLVWFGGKGFRIAEDGGFTDVRDRDFTPEGPVRVAHPALLGEETVAWIEILRDYEILQPFPQLDRPAPALTDEALRTGRLTRYEGVTATFDALGAAIGWERRFTEPGRGVESTWCLERRVPGGWLLADVDPVPDGNEPDRTRTHTLTSVRLTTSRNRRPDLDRPLPGRALDPVAAAELLRDLDAALSDHLR